LNGHDFQGYSLNFLKEMKDIRHNNMKSCPGTMKLFLNVPIITNLFVLRIFLTAAEAVKTEN